MSRSLKKLKTMQKTQEKDINRKVLINKNKPYMKQYVCEKDHVLSKKYIRKENYQKKENHFQFLVLISFSF